MTLPIKEIYVVEKIPGLSLFNWYKLLSLCFDAEDKNVRIYNDQEVNFKEFLAEVFLSYLQSGYPIMREFQQVLDENGYHYSTEHLFKETKKLQSRLTAAYVHATSVVNKKCVGLSLDHSNNLWFMFVETS